MKRSGAAARVPVTNPTEAELAEFGAECGRALLLQGLAKARASQRDASAVLGELSAAVRRAYGCAKGLDERIDALASE